MQKPQSPCIIIIIIIIKPKKNPAGFHQYKHNTAHQYVEKAGLIIELTSRSAERAGEHRNRKKIIAVYVELSLPSPTLINGALGVVRVDTSVGVSPETFLLLPIELGTMSGAQYANTSNCCSAQSLPAGLCDC
jgi:hypothetical protein